MSKRLISLLLSLFIVMGIWPVTVPSASADVAADGTVNNLIYADGRFVAVGVGKDLPGRSVGAIWTSEDGLSWESYKTESLFELYGAAHGDGLFVAVGKSGGIVTSGDGITWKSQSSNTSHALLDVAYGEGQFVTVGIGGTVLTSNDGLSWTPRDSGVTSTLSGIAYGNDVYVAVGTNGMLVTSDDGVSWTNASITSGQLNDVVYGDDGFVAVGEFGTVLQSSDGVTWQTNVTPEGLADLRSVTYGEGRYVAVGMKNAAYTSDDGVTWENRQSGASEDFFGVAYGASKFVMAGTQGFSIFGDGKSWAYPVSVTTTDIYTVDYGNGLFVAGGNIGLILTSTDGTHWNELPAVFEAYQDSVYGGGRFVMVGLNGVIKTSVNGTDWTTAASGVEDALYGVEYGNGTFVAVGLNGRVLTSADGIHWTIQTSGITQRLIDVAYGDGQFITIGNNGGVWTSPDGITWTSRDSIHNLYPTSLAYGNGKFVVTATAGEIATSSDGGASWSVKQVIPYVYKWQSVEYANDTFVAVGIYGYIYTSNDGVTWRDFRGAKNTEISKWSAATFEDAVYGNGMYVAVGSRGLIAQYSIANLSSLQVTGGVLQPEFTHAKTRYTVHTAHDVSSLTVTATTAVAGAGLQINGMAVVSGVESAPISLNLGSNNVDVVVTALDGTEQTYKLNVIREVDPPVNITFDSQGGSTVDSAIGVSVGAKFAKPADPTRVNYLFAGWYQDESYTAPWNFTIDKVKTEMTLYAKWTALYQVTFDSQGGSAVAGLTEVIDGTTVTKPADPTKEGYSFAGWYMDANYAIPWSFASDKVNSDLTLMARWELVPIITYTLMYDPQGGSTVASEAGIISGTTAVRPADPTREGYAFEGWYREAELWTLWSFNEKVTENITLYAKWNVAYTVTFDSQGGSAVANVTGIIAGGSVTRPVDPTREGYTFVGWSTRSGSFIPFHFATDSIGESLVLYANWEPIPPSMFTVSFDSLGGSPVASMIGIRLGEKIDIPEETTRIGHEFLGWYDLENNKFWDFATDTVSGNVMLYGLWKEVTYTVLFDSQGGSVVAFTPTVRAGTTVAKPDDPTKADYTFAGWYTDTSYSTPWNFLVDTVSANTTLYAKWTVEPGSMRTVTFDSQGGSEVASAAGVRAGETVAKPTDPTREGYTFAGWYTEIGYNTEWNFESDVVSTNLTLYAKWDTEKYMIAFDKNDGSETTFIDDLSWGDKISEPPLPTRLGYTFLGWMNMSNGLTWDFATDTVTESILLLASWVQGVMTYTVTFDSQGGSNVDSANDVSAGETITKPTNPTRTGYTFTGWYRDSGYVTPWDFEKNTISRDITLYAKWEIISSGNGGGVVVPDNSEVVSDNGVLSLPAGRPGEVSLKDKEITIEIPAGAMDESIRLTIEALLDTEELLANDEELLSQVFEVLKNVPGNFKKNIKLTLAFDSAKLSGDQRASIFYFDEVAKEWVEVGGVVSGGIITAEVDHFTKFAVLAVNESSMPEAEFSDIAGHWAAEAIQQGALEGIVTGYPDGTFRPNLTVTRAQFAVMLMNAIKHPEAAVQLTFEDTAQIPGWANHAVSQAVQAGIVTGYEDGTFRPNAEITRAEMAVMMAKAIGLKGELNSNFADDESIPAWARGSVAELKALGLIQGVGGNRFDPVSHATRAEAVTILTALANKSR